MTWFQGTRNSTLKSVRVWKPRWRERSAVFAQRSWIWIKKLKQDCFSSYTYFSEPATYVENLISKSLLIFRGLRLWWKRTFQHYWPTSLCLKCIGSSDWSAKLHEGMSVCSISAELAWWFSCATCVWCFAPLLMTVEIITGLCGHKCSKLDFANIFEDFSSLAKFQSNLFQIEARVLPLKLSVISWTSDDINCTLSTQNFVDPFNWFRRSQICN